jgi:flagellar hook-associated protein 1 FlgK
MGLDSALSIATGGLANINAQFQLISQNVANASTPGYATEVSSQHSLTAEGVALGVRTGPATLQINQALQASVVHQNATVADLQTTQTALQTVDSTLGTPGSGNDLASLLGNLQNSFSTLLTNPSSQAQQQAVVTSATALSEGINQLSDAYSTQRQAAQNALGPAVNTLNSTLSAIGQLSAQIIALKPTNQSVADLENQRNAAVQTLSQLVDIKTIEQPNGDLSIFSASGLTLPTQAANPPFTIASATTSPAAYYPGGGVPGITMGGLDVTNQFTGGQIGANVRLRDSTMPTYQAQLDEFAEGLSSRFSAQGLTLFTDPSGNVPTGTQADASTGASTPAQSGYVGYAAVIQVNKIVSGNPALVRDGTNNATDGTFTPNLSGGPAGSTTLIANITDFALGSQTQTNGPQPALNSSGLGASGRLGVAFSAGGNSLSNYASGLIADQAQQSAATTNNLTTEQALQTSLNAKSASISGVNMDNEMSRMLTLQTAYSANARVIAAAQSMVNQLLQIIQ